MANLLIVDDELGMRQFLTHLFQREGHMCASLKTVVKQWTQLRATSRPI